MPLSIAEFFDRLRESGVLAPEEFESLAARFPAKKRFRDSNRPFGSLVACLPPTQAIV